MHLPSTASLILDPLLWGAYQAHRGLLQHPYSHHRDRCPARDISFEGFRQLNQWDPALRHRTFLSNRIFDRQVNPRTPIEEQQLT